MYRVDRNNFYKEQKNATVYTPQRASEFLFSILERYIPVSGYVLDPCVGKGSLIEPFKRAGYAYMGIDIEDQGFPSTIIENYLTLDYNFFAESPSLVVMNPPFNVDQKTKSYIKEHYSGRPLLPEVWLMKTIELFGTKIPMVLFTPYGFRLNQSQNSKRWRKFILGHYPEISSIISLPKDVFDGILFHSEILIFNVDGLKAHYFLPDL
ncbi:hypothetical protein PVA44_04110 [Entomospira nematocerorum]|uniref:SAM-dependent methyltransferase n=1 Tax=Entomospira nematocerorum TaxID=2719987 RepID=A0A968KV25_9SPIO|nr:SAM-dependent methyltransferase [Entomospira nematocera]NIZ46788.1 SAM-dependent methyltransferase [Entomospira nematocera]WDI33415.1 hypothetical protein PVA44_04110 [Entomospira nematocera]